MDEPLSNLDAKLRVQMRSEVARIQHELKATTVYVTHDQVEAMTMGDRVALMRRGVLQQVDTPMRLYNAPANLFVASFIGSPAMNLFEAALERATATWWRRSATSSCAWSPSRSPSPTSSSATSAAPSARRAPRAHRGRDGGDGRAGRASPARRGALARGAGLRADRAPRDRGQAGDDRRGQGGRRRHRRHDGRRARGRRARRQAAARRPLRRRLARAGGPDGRDRRRHQRVHFFDLESGLAVGGHPVARRPDHGHHRPSGAPRRRAPGPARAASALDAETRTALCCSCCPSFVGFVVFYAYPALRGFYLSFTNYDLLAVRRAGSGSTTTARCSRTRCSGTRSGSRSSTSSSTSASRRSSRWGSRC